ncbi:hypothetical protein JCM33374_g1608 [Metschnikowia sp. JCM 33374]|nr:hypothetical protein JCM33374_g1608 [Metschnikowia sp. JCM 33374]
MELVLKLELVSNHKNKGRSDHHVFLREFSETETRAHRFTALITTLRLVTQNLRRQTTTTLRDIFYKDVSAFQGSQTRSNDCLKLVSNSLGFSLERDLKINPSPKGLVYGGPHLHLQSKNTHISLSYNGEYVLVPASISDETIFTSEHIDAVIITEKEAVFKSFSAYLQVLRNARTLITLTGKGNPDKASTRFLGALRRSFNNLPVFVFVDSDVYGLRIFWTYMLAAGGPASSVVFAGTFLLEHERGYLTIAQREWKLMMNFLKEVTSFESSFCKKPETSIRLIKRELTRGMLLGKKAELNVMCDTSPDDSLNEYMWKRIAQQMCDKT